MRRAAQAAPRGALRAQQSAARPLPGGSNGRREAAERAAAKWEALLAMEVLMVAAMGAWMVEAAAAARVAAAG